jgi:hypothetical protein
MTEMTTNTTKTATVAAVALALVAVMLAYSTMVLPVSAQTATPPTSASTPISNSNAVPGQLAKLGGQPVPLQGGPMRGPMRGGYGPVQQQANLTVGQTINVSTAQGKFYAVGNAKDNGTASGSITFTVTGKLAAGYTLSITQGTIVVNGTTYTVSSGSAQLDRSASALVGQGATTPSGQFLIRASAHGNFVGTTATMSLDLNAGTTEYLVFLAGSVQG